MSAARSFLQRLLSMVFRKRLEKGGYANVSILKIMNSPNYLVSVVEPIAHMLVSRECSASFMYMHLNPFLRTELDIWNYLTYNYTK